MLLVVIPFTTAEVPLVLKNLALARKLDGRQPNPVLVAYEEGTVGVPDVVQSALLAFETVQTFSYHRGPTGWPMGPNHAFKMTAFHLGEQKNPHAWLWWEADATPLCRGWLEILSAAYQAAGKPFAGHVVEGMGHMNGVGLYPPDVRQYSVKALTSVKTPWDVAMKADTAHLTHPLNHLILHYWNIVAGSNYNGPAGEPLSVRNRKELKQWITPEAVLLHRCKDGTVAEVLLK